MIIVSLTYGIVIFLCVYVAQEPMKLLVNSMPEWLTHGFEIAGGILPAVGFGLLLKIMFKFEYLPFLIIGFIMSIFLNFSNLLPVALIGTAIAIYKYYEDISKKDINEYDSITINNIQNENTYTDLINEVYEITNNYRSLVEVSSLTLDSSLVEAANIRAKELSDSFSHTRPNGSSCFTVLSELGISYGTAGENIAAGYSSSQSVMEGWRSSSGHYQNIISSKFKKIGIGVNIINNQYYWVQIFSN